MNDVFIEYLDLLFDLYERIGKNREHNSESTEQIKSRLDELWKHLSNRRRHVLKEVMQSLEEKYASQKGELSSEESVLDQEFI